MMNEQVMQPKFEMAKWIFIVFLLMGGIVLNAVFSDVYVVFRFVAWVVLAAIALLIAYQTQRGKAAWVFAKAAQTEIKKVVWPTRRETIQMTLVIVFMVFIMSMLLWGIDSVLLWAVSLLTERKG